VSLANGRSPGAALALASDTRGALVAALDSVDGITAYPVAPDAATAGAGFPRWVQTTYRGALCDPTEDTYDVYLILPGDYLATTADEGDRLRALTAPALAAVGHVDYCEPVAVTFNDHQTMPGIRFRVTVRKG
jgi:hypothetical protein